MYWVEPEYEEDREESMKKKPSFAFLSHAAKQRLMNDLINDLKKGTVGSEALESLAAYVNLLEMALGKEKK